MKLPISILGAALMLQAQPALAQTTTPDLQVPAGATLLEVVAQGRTSRVPDIATIRAGVVTQDQSAAAALNRNATHMDSVLEALDKAGIADRDIQTASVSLNPQYKYADDQPPVITGYQASNSVSVRFRDIDKSGAILDALVAEGANQINGPDLSIDAIENARDAARRDAIKQARDRARLYADAAGLSVSRILSISEGDSPSPSPRPVAYARAEAPASHTTIAAGEQDVTETVTVRFLLK